MVCAASGLCKRKKGHYLATSLVRFCQLESDVVMWAQATISVYMMEATCEGWQSNKMEGFCIGRVPDIMGLHYPPGLLTLCWLINFNLFRTQLVCLCYNS